MSYDPKRRQISFLSELLSHVVREQDHPTVSYNVSQLSVNVQLGWKLKLKEDSII